MNRRIALTLAAAVLALAACGKSSAPAEGDMALGAAEGAKVTVVEYASVACHACAMWHQENWAAFKAKYVDTNKVRFVFREMLTGDPNVAVKGFLLARCSGADNYFKVAHGVLEEQEKWHDGKSPDQSFDEISKSVGINEAKFEACMADEAQIQALEARNNAARDAGIGGTPTFLVNGKRVLDHSMEGLSAAIDPLLAQ